MLGNFFHKKSIKVKWLWAYTIIFAVPVLASIIFFSGMSRKMYHQIAAQNLNVLEQKMNELENMFLETERICGVLELDPDINDYINLPDGKDKEKMYRLRKIKECLVRNTINLPADKMAVGLYFKDIDMVLTKDGMYEKSEFYECFSDKSSDIDKWYDDLITPGNTSFTKTNFIFRDNKVSKSIGYKKQIPYQGRKIITLIVNYNVESLLDNISEISFMKEQSIIIEDENTNEIYSDNMEKIPDKIRDKANKDNNQIIKFNDYVVTHIPSRISGLKYTCCIPIKQFFQEYRYIRTMFIIFTIVVFLIGFSIITILLNINYAPLKRIMQKNIIEKGDEENEFYALSKFINQNVTEKTELLAICNENRNIVTEYVITRLLTGEVSSKKDIKRMITQQNIDIKPTWYYIIMMIRVENKDDFFSDTSMNLTERNQMINFMINNVLEELMEQLSYKGYLVPIDEKIFYVVGGANINKQCVIDKFKYAQKVFEDQFGVCMSASVSNVNYGYEGMNICFNQAVEGMNELVIYDNKDIVLYEDVETQRSENLQKTEKDKNLLLSLFAKQDAEQVKEYLKFLFASWMSDDNFSVHNYRVFRLETVGVFLQSISEHVCPDEVRVQLQKTLMDIEKQDFSPSKTLLILESVADELCRGNEKAIIKNNLVERVKDYIDNNYFDSNINIQILGKKFEISEGYLSQLFKQQMNISILDYISGMRIAKATELLKDKKNTNEMIYTAVGFTNKSTFIRVFKRQTGMTPKQYRETIK